jgi:hypothetical protein
MLRIAYIEPFKLWTTKGRQPRARSSFGPEAAHTPVARGSRHRGIYQLDSSCLFLWLFNR